MDSISTWEPRRSQKSPNASPSGVEPVSGAAEVETKYAVEHTGQETPNGYNRSPVIDADHDPDDPNDSFQRTKLAEQQLEQDDLDAAARVVDELTEQLASEIGQIKTLTAVMRARQADRDMHAGHDTAQTGHLLQVAERQFHALQQQLAAEAQARDDRAPASVDGTGAASGSDTQSPVPEDEVHDVYLPDGTRLLLYNDMLLDEAGNQVPWETLGPGAGPHLLVQVAGPQEEKEEEEEEEDGGEQEDDDQMGGDGGGSIDSQGSDSGPRQAALATEITIGSPSPMVSAPASPQKKGQIRNKNSDSAALLASPRTGREYDSDSEVVGQGKSRTGTRTGTGTGTETGTPGEGRGRVRARPAGGQMPFNESKQETESESELMHASGYKLGTSADPAAEHASSSSSSSSWSPRRAGRLARRPTEMRTQFLPLQDKSMSLHRQIQEENRKRGGQGQRSPEWSGASALAAGSRPVDDAASGGNAAGNAMVGKPGQSANSDALHGGASPGGIRRRQQQQQQQRRRRAASVRALRPSNILSSAVTAMRHVMRKDYGIGHESTGAGAGRGRGRESEGATAVYGRNSKDTRTVKIGRGADTREQMSQLREQRAILEQQAQDGVDRGHDGGRSYPPHRRGEGTRAGDEVAGAGAGPRGRPGERGEQQHSFAFIDVDGGGDGGAGGGEGEQGQGHGHGHGHFRGQADFEDEDEDGLEVEGFRMMSEGDEDEEPLGGRGRGGGGGMGLCALHAGAGAGSSTGSGSRQGRMRMGHVAMPDPMRGGDLPPELHGAEAALMGVGTARDVGAPYVAGRGGGSSLGAGTGTGTETTNSLGFGAGPSTISDSVSQSRYGGGGEDDEDDDDDGFKHFGQKGSDGRESGEVPGSGSGSNAGNSRQGIAGANNTGTGLVGEAGAGGEGDHQQVVREGQLWKADRHGARWKRRWACVCPEKLYYFASDSQAHEAKGEGNMELYKPGIDLHMCTVVIQKKSPNDKVPSGCFPFTLQCGSRKFWFAATSTMERRVWVTMLCQITQESPEVVLEGVE